jgi:hypothetical protein
MGECPLTTFLYANVEAMDLRVYVGIVERDAGCTSHRRGRGAGMPSEDAVTDSGTAGTPEGLSCG